MLPTLSCAFFEAACSAGCAKARLRSSRLPVMGFLGGACIAFGGFLALSVGRASPALAEANPGVAQLLFGALFPLGYILALNVNGELFTGNCGVITPACLTGAARWNAMFRNWVVVYIGNLIGSVFVALFLAYWTGLINGGMLGDASAAIAEAKVNIGFFPALLRGVGCNWLVCLAVWLAISADDIAGKILAIWWPIMAFVALGLEHSVANMFFIPLGMFNGADVTIGQFLFANLLPVTIGNIIGGAGFVGAVYWWIYGRD